MYLINPSDFLSNFLNSSSLINVSPIATCHSKSNSSSKRKNVLPFILAFTFTLAFGFNNCCNDFGNKISMPSNSIAGIICIKKRANSPLFMMIGVSPFAFIYSSKPFTNVFNCVSDCRIWKRFNSNFLRWSISFSLINSVAFSWLSFMPMFTTKLSPVPSSTTIEGWYCFWVM